MKNYATKLSTKFQLVIPQEIRKILNVKKGDYVVFQVNDEGKIELKKGNIIINVEDG